MEITDLLLDYAARHSTPEDALLLQLNRETNLRTVYPNMCSGSMQGKLLEMLSHMIRPARILEIGTFTGYSAICMAKGLAPGGRLHTMDLNDETGTIATRYFRLAGMDDRIHFHQGDARTIVPQLQEDFDLIFIDGDKKQYLDYYHLVMPRLKKGGYIIADNVLWGGKVTAAIHSHDKETQGIIDFNTFVVTDPRVEKLLLPLRDGLFILRKICG